MQVARIGVDLAKNVFQVHVKYGPKAPLLKPEWTISTHWINAD